MQGLLKTLTLLKFSSIQPQVNLVSLACAQL